MLRFRNTMTISQQPLKIAKSVQRKMSSDLQDLMHAGIYICSSNNATSPTGGWQKG